MTCRAPCIFQYWDTDTVPDYILDLFATFRDRNPDFQHCVLSRSTAERFIAEHFGRREADAFRACAIPAMQSDFLSYCAVLARGGVYADADYRCDRSLRPLVEESAGGEIFLGPTPHTVAGREAKRVWNGFFAFKEPGHPLLRLTLDIATVNMEARIAERVWPPGENVVEAIWLTVGPGILSLLRFIRDWGSLDAFVDGTRGTPAEPFSELYCEAIGSYDRVAGAFEGVRVSPYERMTTWVMDPDFPLPYKDTEANWHNVKTTIFR